MMENLGDTEPEDQPESWENQDHQAEQSGLIKGMEDIYLYLDHQDKQELAALQEIQDTRDS